MRRFRTTGAAGMLLGGALLGCNDLSGFTTAPGESYCGSVTLGEAFRTGFSPLVQMRLAFNAAAIETNSSPGTITTYEVDTPGLAGTRMLDGADLRPIPAMENDPISQLQFGDGRVRNLIYAVSPSDPTAESILAVVSLKTDGTVEVRLIRGGLLGTTAMPTPAGSTTLFGLFPLSRQAGSCGF
jgi:hypothetical protein